MPHIDPGDLETLMSIAVIKAGFLQNAVVAGDPETLFLVRDKHAKGKIGGVGGADCDVYNIVNMTHRMADSDPTGSIFSYIVDYLPGETNFHILGSKADFCFTVTINGCTFALGAPAADGTLMVSHTNMKKSGSARADRETVLGGVDYPPELGGAVQENLQARIVREMYGAGTMLGPSQYYNPAKNNNLTVFGIRDAGGWTFRYQSYKYENHVFYHEGVHGFAANAIAI